LNASSDCKGPLLHRFLDKPWAAALILLAACWLNYGAILGNAYLLDDHTFLRGEHARVYASFGEYFTENHTHHYSPLYLAVNVALFSHFGGNPELLHAACIMLFYLSCLLFTVWLGRVSADKPLALLAGLFFCLHPINAFTVNYISSNAIFIMAIFLLACLLAHEAYIKDRRHPLTFVLGILSFVMALLCFEGALLLPAFIGLTAFFMRRQSFVDSLKETLPYVLIALVYLGVWIYMASGQAGLGEKWARLDMSVGNYLATLFYLLSWYGSNLIAPFDVVFLKNAAPLTGALWPYGLAALAMALGMIYLVLRIWKRSLVTCAVLWLAAGAVLAAAAAASHADMGLVLEPHWLYFSSLGFFILLGAYLRRWQRRMPLRVWSALVLLLAGSCWALTQTYNALARTEKGYCLYWLSRTPGNIIASMRLGELYYYEKDYPASASHLSYAAARYTNKKTRSRLLHNLGHVYSAWGYEDLAAEKYREAIGVRPSFAAPYIALAGQYSEAGERSLAVATLEKFVQLNPFHPDISLIQDELLKLKEE
jgi:tetratricopeptide (TPR) repeat protein